MSSRLFADLSSNNSDFNALEYRRAGGLVVAIKATEGPRSYVNPDHRAWCLHAGIHHIAVIHYHFARPDTGSDPRREADFFCDVALPLCGGRDYLVCDLERPTPYGYAHDPAWSVKFDLRVQERSRFHTILYANRSTLEISDKWLHGDRRRVWDADWTNGPDYAPPGYDCAMRQFTDGLYGPLPHGVPGVEGHCDVSRLGRVMYDRLLASQPHRARAILS